MLHPKAHPHNLSTINPVLPLAKQWKVKGKGNIMATATALAPNLYGTGATVFLTGELAHFDDVFLWRQRVNDLDETSFLGQVSQYVVAVSPPRHAEVVGPVGARVRWSDMNKPTMRSIWNQAVRNRINVHSDLHNKTTAHHQLQLWLKSRSEIYNCK